MGPTGVGKTHLARALAHLVCRKYMSVLFHNFTSLLGEITKAELTGKRESFLKPLLKCDLLVIDDFAFKKLTPQTAEYLYMIVDGRYQQKSMMLTSNRAMEDWLGIFPDPVMANAVMDRLAHNAHQIVIQGESYRKLNGMKMKNGK
jgi:DNA replication protein DnaC